MCFITCLLVPFDHILIHLTWIFLLHNERFFFWISWEIWKKIWNRGERKSSLGVRMDRTWWKSDASKILESNVKERWSTQNHIRSFPPTKIYSPISYHLQMLKGTKTKGTHLTASSQIFSPPLLIQIFCSRTGVPVCAALIINPSRMKIPTCATRFAQSPFVAQNNISPSWAFALGRCLPREEWYWSCATRGIFLSRALQTEYCVSPAPKVLFGWLIKNRIERGITGAVKATAGFTIAPAAAPNIGKTFLGFGRRYDGGATIRVWRGRFSILNTRRFGILNTALFEKQFQQRFGGDRNWLFLPEWNYPPDKRRRWKLLRTYHWCLCRSQSRILCCKSSWHSIAHCQGRWGSGWPSWNLGMCNWMFFGRFLSHPAAILERTKMLGGRKCTGVVQEDPTERSSRGMGTKAMAKVAAESQTREEKSCIVLMAVDKYVRNSYYFYCAECERKDEEEAAAEQSERSFETVFMSFQLQRTVSDWELWFGGLKSRFLKLYQSRQMQGRIYMSALKAYGYTETILMSFQVQQTLFQDLWFGGLPPQFSSSIIFGNAGRDTHVSCRSFVNILKLHWCLFKFNRLCCRIYGLGACHPNSSARSYLAMQGEIHMSAVEVLWTYWSFTDVLSTSTDLFWLVSYGLGIYAPGLKPGDL